MESYRIQQIGSGRIAIERKAGILDPMGAKDTRENVRLTFDHKVEQVIQEIVDSNFDLYRRITDDPVFGEVIKNLLFDQYLRNHRSAEELSKRSRYGAAV